MRKLLLHLTIMFCASSLFAQWIPVNNGLPDFSPSTIINWVDTMVVSTYGGGIYLSYNQGENWSEMPGTLPNLFVNNIMYRGGQFDPIAVSTEGGPFISVNGDYIDCNGTGLSNTSVSFWSGIGESLPYIGDAIIGTNGSGVFGCQYTSPFIYDWFPANAGLSANALFVNDGIAIGEDGVVIATNDGIYMVEGDEMEWTAYSNGLSGNALNVNSLNYLGLWIISTDGGLYYAQYLADTWQPILADEKFNLSFYINTELSPSGFMVYAFGENGYYTQDFETWNQMDFGDIEGEVTAAAADQENVYIGFTMNKKDGKASGGLYKKPIEQFIVGIEDNAYLSEAAVLNQNYPNPFSKSTEITFIVTDASDVCIKIHNVLGNEIQNITKKCNMAGIHSIQYDASHLKKGIYFYTLIINEKFIETKRMIIN